jgi:hypothetical protein
MKWLLKFLNGSAFTLSFGGGGSSAPAPTTQTVQQSNIPEYAAPYFHDIMQRGQAASQSTYQPYTGPRVADFTPMQQQAFQGIQNLGPSQLNAPAAGMTMGAGIGGMQAQNQYAQQATNPGAMQSYMSPYMQNVVDWQKSQAIQDYGRQLPGQQAAATRAGAFGGSRQAIVESEAQRNLQNQLAGIQATGTQNAFEQANKNLQFGSDLGIRGLGLAGQMGGQLGQIGQTAFGQQATAAQAQQQAGAIQQAQGQQGMDVAYEEFMRQQQNPWTQLQNLSSLLRGSVVSPNQTMFSYQAPASTANQLASLGLGAYGTSKLFGAKDGGEIKRYAVGGIVGGMSMQQLFDLARSLPDARLLAIMKGQPGEVDPGTAMTVFKMRQQTRTANEGETAQHEAQKPSVLQQMTEQAGLEAVPVGNMDIPAGGIAGEEEPVALAEGGLTRWSGRYSVPDPVTGKPWTQHQGNRRMQQAEVLTKQRRNEAARLANKPLPFPEVGYPMGPQAEPDPDSFFQTSSTGLRMLPGEEATQDVGLTEPTAADVAATPAVGKPPARTRRTAPTGIAKLVPSGSSTLLAQQTAQDMQEGPGVTPPPPPESETDMLKRFAGVAGDFMKEPRDALRKAEQESQEKGKKGLEDLRNESKGVAALRAAAALVDPKNQGSRLGGIGAAFGAAGETGADYGKQKRTLEKDLEKARMDAMRADVAFKQGDFELGSKLMGMSQTRILEAAKLAADKAYRDAMVDLQGRQLSETERNNRALEAYRDKYLQVTREVGLARADGRTGFTPAQRATARNNALGKMQSDLKDPKSQAFRALRAGVPQEQLLDAYTDFMLTGDPLRIPSLQMSEAPGEVAGKLQVPKN